jgi:cation-transporting ATPase 13A2
MDYPSWKLDDYSLRPKAAPAHLFVEGEEEEAQDYALVLTGDVFRWMVNFAASETLHRVRIFYCG